MEDKARNSVDAFDECIDMITCSMLTLKLLPANRCFFLWSMTLQYVEIEARYNFSRRISPRRIGDIRATI